MTDSLQISNDTAEITVNEEGLIKVFRKEAHTLRIFSTTPDGDILTRYETKETTTGAERRLLEAFDRMPLLAAVWDGDSWSVDTEAGVQRWLGCMSENKIKTGLRRLGFTVRQIGQVFRKAKEHTWICCPRQG